MGLREGCYAKVWAVQENANHTQCYGQISVNKRVSDSKTGEKNYEIAYSGYVTFANKAREKALALGLPTEVDRQNRKYRSIKITSSPDISTYCDNERRQKSEKWVDSLAPSHKSRAEFASFIKGLNISDEDRQKIYAFLKDGLMSESDQQKLKKFISKQAVKTSITIWDFELSENK